MVLFRADSAGSEAAGADESVFGPVAAGSPTMPKRRAFRIHNSRSLASSSGVRVSGLPGSCLSVVETFMSFIGRSSSLLWLDLWAKEHPIERVRMNRTQAEIREGEDMLACSGRLRSLFPVVLESRQMREVFENIDG